MFTYNTYKMWYYYVNLKNELSYFFLYKFICKSLRYDLRHIQLKYKIHIIFNLFE